jgi:GT2 family glycosyltransferase
LQLTHRPPMNEAERQQVDVGVVTWNTAVLTTQALRSLLDADQGCELRVLVRDNASTDGTTDELRRTVPEAEVDAGTENLGFAAGVNTLIRRSKAPWLLLLNSDAWPEPGAIARLLETAKEHPRAAAVAPLLLRPDGDLEHSTFPFPSLRVAAVMAFARGRMSNASAERMLLEGAWMHDRPRAVDWAVGAALLIRRDALDEVGALDERFFMYVEDLDWCWRARRKGWEIRFDPRAVVRHIGNVSGAQRYGDRRTAAYLANTYRFFRREHGPASAAAYRAINLAGVSLRYLQARAARDRAKAGYWRSVLDAHRAAIRDAAPRGAR